MATELQLKLKACKAKTEEISGKYADGQVWAQEDVASFEAAINEAKSIARQIDLQKAASELGDWMQQPDGQSAVKNAFSREALPDEGKINGVTAEGPELYALKGIGEQKLAALKSGAYKDAFNAYVRNIGMGRAMKGDAMKVLQEGLDESGGYWVPPDMRADVIKKIATMAVIRNDSFAFTTGSNMVSFPKVTYTTDDKYSSGARFSWTAEAPSADISETTNPVAGRVNIPVHTATAAIILTRAQLEDNQFDLLGYVSQILGEAFALGEEDAFISGDGVGKPLGIQKHPNATTAHSSGGMSILSGTSGKLDWGVSNTAGEAATGVLGVEAALPPQYENGAKWYANKKTYSALRALTDTAQRPLWNPNDAWPNLANGGAATLLGYPIRKSQFMPDIASTAYPIMLADLGGYYIADRVGLSIEVLREIRALRDEVVIYARKRVGGQLVHDWRVKQGKSHNA